MKLRNKQVGASLVLILSLAIFAACNPKNENTLPSSEDPMPISNPSTEESTDLEGSADLAAEPSMDKDYDQMTKDEKISFLEDKIFSIRVKARSLEMKLEENPQLSDKDKKKIQDSIDGTDALIESLNEEIDKLENK